VPYIEDDENKKIKKPQAQLSDSILKIPIMLFFAFAALINL
jgi:hypothetical protein